MKTTLTPKETEYMEYLGNPRTTKELCGHFSVKKNACWQVMRTLRLKQLVHHTQCLVFYSFPLLGFYKKGYWKITEDTDIVEPITVTPLQRKYIEYLRTPHSTREMTAQFNQKESAVQQVTRTIRLMGYVESIGHGSARGHGGCWKLWKSTEEGIKILETEK